MKKILVPFDFSGASFNAVHHAIRMAQQTKAEITFLCSRQLAVIEDDEPGEHVECPTNRQPVLLWQLLQNMLKALCINEKQSQVHYLFQESLEAKSLEAVLQGNNYDLLVIGIEGAEGQTPLPWERRMVEYLMHIPTPVLIVPHKAASQLVGTISLVTDSMNMREKQAMTVLFDLTEAFQAHLQIIYVGRQKGETYSFRQALKQLGLASRLDIIRHTYHFVQPFGQQELEEIVNQDNTNWLVLFKYPQAAKPEMDTLRQQIMQSRVPLLLLPFTEEAARRTVPPGVTLERAAFANAY
jgi:nucleotide-binding universal stress UspA family protein